MIHILFALQTAFSLWMLVDAIRRGAEYYWWIIVMVPFGEWAYFFAVYMQDPKVRGFWKGKFSKPATLDQLRYEARSSPSVHNRVRLAQALHDAGQYDEAAGMFRSILDSDAGNKESLHGLGICLIKLGDKTAAVEPLEKVVDLDQAYADYSPCADLALAYWEGGRKEDAVNLLSRISKHSQRLRHRTELAGYLVQLEKNTEAKKILMEALEDYEHSPSYVKRSDSRWAKLARGMLKTL